MKKKTKKQDTVALDVWINESVDVPPFAYLI